MADAEQQFYNGVYPDGSPPDGGGCEPVDDLGVQASWCWAPMEFARLLMVTNDLGVELEWFGATDQPAGVNEAQDVVVLTCVAVRILDTVGEKGSIGR